jgi:hypothetical protein
MSFTNELLPEPLTPVTQMNVPSGKLDIDISQIVVACPQDSELLVRRFAACFRNGDLIAPRQKLTGQAAWGLLEFGQMSLAPRLHRPRTPGPGPKSTR